MNDFEWAALAAVDGGAPPKLWHVGPQAGVVFGSTGHPFDGMVVTHWARG